MWLGRERWLGELCPGLRFIIAAKWSCAMSHSVSDWATLHSVHFTRRR
jgi:hypothetical protein